MIYDDNRKNERLDRELFKKPTSEYRGAPFWAWNCELERDELLRQIDIFKEMGLGGFHIHCREGMATKYLSEEFMELVKACTNRAKENGMLTWLYDEDKFPSGFGGGYVTKDYEFRRRYVVFTCDPNYRLRSFTKILSRFDVILDGDGCLKSYREVGDNDDIKGTLWSVYLEIADNDPWFNNQSYVDTLNKKAIDRFIEVTHEQYFEAVGEEFGKNIYAIFTDEPQFMHKEVLKFAESREDLKLPWTDDLDDTYKNKYGESLLERFPELVWELPDGEISLARYRYHDHLAERFTEAFADNCGNWCREHGIGLSGHMMDEPTLHSQTSSIGDCMRSYRAFGIPGIDMLCAYFEFTTAKQCQSAVHQYGRPGMMSELYGVTGWDFDFRGHKLHGDWQAALGVTVRVQHLSWVSMKGTAKRDYPASISYQSPWYKEYSYVEDHFGRVNTALTRGKPLVKVAVVHPVESYWLHFGPNEQTALVREKLNSNFMNVTNWLLRGNIDFDYICESLFPEQCEKGGAPLKVGEMAYDVVIVPECETLRSTTLERLEAFRAAGGKLVFMGDAPKYEDARVSERGKKLYEASRQIAFSKGALLDELKEDRTVEIRDFAGNYTNSLIHQIRRDEKGLWLFISHCDEPYNKDVARSMGIHIYVKGKYKAELWDTVTGEVKPTRYSNSGNITHIIMSLYDYDSALLFLEDTDETCGYEPVGGVAPQQLNLAPALVDYSLSEPNVLLLDMPMYAFDGEELRGPEEILRIDSEFRSILGYPLERAQPWVLPSEPPQHSVTMEHTIYSEIDYMNPYLALEAADETEMFWNGEKVEYKDAGYYTDKAIRKVALPALKKGINTLRVTIPFGERSNCEAMYLLGEFGVSVQGKRLTVTPLPEKIGFSDLTYQGMPFYGGVVSYHVPVDCDSDWDMIIKLPHYRAAVNTVEVDGDKVATIAYPPYAWDIGVLKEGKHTVTVNTYVSRRNCFGDVHDADERFVWQEPVAWMQKDSLWTYEYRLRRTGLLTEPWFYKR